jgi:putative endonuclease
MKAKAPSAKRTAAFRFGLSAESRAALLLVAKGFRVLARRWKSAGGEIDIVARRGRLIVFVEVKGRGALSAAAESVLPRQRRRIVTGAEAWLAAHPEHEGYDFRFDAILVAPGTLPEHIQSAFEVET